MQRFIVTHPVRSVVAVAAAALLTSSLLVAATPEKKQDDDSDDAITLSPFEINVTPGGAKDANFFRMGVRSGHIPHPDTITAEGLFSEHDLPAAHGQHTSDLISVETAAIPARFDVLPSVRFLAQLGFSSNLDARAWHREPLNFIAVVDKSGSMNGHPLDLVRASLHRALGHLRDGDQFGIVLYGDRAHVHLAPTPVTANSRSAIEQSIDAIVSSGSTSMEAGLQMGYAVARRSARKFRGVTRLMLFTDERPNVGATNAESFMAMARTGAQAGIGLTTVGVGEQFDAQLATTISSVRGANLYYFSDEAEMMKTYESDFDTMVTELAHDLSVRLEPAPGLRIEGVFGVPANVLRWEGNAIVLDVSTLFVSHRHGGIFFALGEREGAPDLPVRTVRTGETLATISYRYTKSADNVVVRHDVASKLLPLAQAQAGLTRGAVLVDEYLTMKKAVQSHVIQNDQETAYRLMDGLRTRFASVADPDLANEQTLVHDLYAKLALLSGHTSEIAVADGREDASPLLGVWRVVPSEATALTEFIVVWPSGVIEWLSPTRGDERYGEPAYARSVTVSGALPAQVRGTLELSEEDRAAGRTIKFSVESNRLVLELLSDRAEAERVECTRAKYADIVATERGSKEKPAIDGLSGLPLAAGEPSEVPPDVIRIDP